MLSTDFRKILESNMMKIRPIVTRSFMRTDRHDEADSRTSQFYGRGKNLNGIQALNLTPRPRRWLRTNQGGNLVLPGIVSHITLHVSYYLFSTNPTTKQPSVKGCILTSLQTVVAHHLGEKQHAVFF
jgi:hypothetical protein